MFYRVGRHLKFFRAEPVPNCKGNNMTNESMALSRRSFLKTSAVATGAVAVTGALPLGSQALATTEEKERTIDYITDSVCRPNCFAYCHMNFHVRNGNIVKTSRADFKDTDYNRICLRGLSHVQRIYGEDRIKHPMRRVGERGSGEWEQITWEEAIEEVTSEFKRIQSTYGSQAVAFSPVSGNIGMLNGNVFGVVGMLMNTIKATSIEPSVDAALTMGVNRVCGNMGPWVGNEAKDMINAKTIITWGSNLTEAQPQEWHFLQEAIEAGTKLIVIDPTFTELASKADKWIPIRPGADGALALSMMNVIISENLIDREFLIKHTVAPFLVNTETGRFLHGSEIGIPATQGPADELTGEPTVIDPSACWDNATSAPVLADLAASPSLSGAHEINGVLYRTAYDLLQEEVAKYPPAVAEGLTEIPAKEIIELARTSAQGPVTHRCGFGPQAYNNGVHTIHAGITMCALTGNIGKPGASYGASWNLYPGVNWMMQYPNGINMNPSISTLALRNVMRTGKFLGMDYPIKGMIVYTGNPLSTAVNTNELRSDVFDKMEFIVTVDSTLTDTARYSDILLPCAMWFEVEDVIPGGQTHYIQHAKKVIDPLYESKSDADIFRMIGDKMGVGEYIPQDNDEFLTKALDSELGKMFWINYPILKSQQAMRYMADPFIAWEGNNFLTPSGRMEFYIEEAEAQYLSELPVDQDREHLPRFIQPAEAWPENELYEKYPFVCMSERARWRAHTQWYANPWINELAEEPTVKMNPIDAKAKSFESGQYLECFNDRGHAVARLIISDGVRPGTLVYPKGWQAFQHKAGCWSELLSSVYDPVGVNQNFMDVLCDVRKWEGA